MRKLSIFYSYIKIICKTNSYLYWLVMLVVKPALKTALLGRKLTYEKTQFINKKNTIEITKLKILINHVLYL